MPLIPNGAVTACSYEYKKNSDGTVTQTWKTCSGGCPQNPKPDTPSQSPK